MTDELTAAAARAATRAVRAGQLAPTFRLEDLHGGTARLVDLLERGPLVISFYRGVWCDYCGLALEALAGIDRDIHELNATHVAIGPAPSDEVQRRRLSDFSMPVLADGGLRVTRSYGLVITLPEALRDRYRTLGYHPANMDWQIPIPATYVIERTGKIVLAAIDLDYRNRLDPGQVLTALHCLKAKARS